MKEAQAAITFYRRDYKAPNHRINETHLEFRLHPEHTQVSSRLVYAPWSEDQPDGLPIELDGEDLKLVSVTLNGQLLNENQYEITEGQLIISDAPKSGTLEIKVEINPSANTRLEGLYLSNGNYFTQCEAQGFRHITYFPDRPDVLSVFTVRLIAPKASHPVTLSNGNLIEEKDLDDGMHLSVWEDPFPKPAYLFAIVGGQFVCQEDKIKKLNGKEALLQVWVEPGNLDKTDFAMQSLKKAIQWDQSRFELDLDLDRFMIVATADFNMGAMENKGLNIFNTKFVFANPRLATDIDFENVESVVGHEYFHNWTGNRVTCRDWFQLSLKEGLTVFRDQEFSSDMLSAGLAEEQALSARAIKRIGDVKVLRAAQFPEDAGPMAHPIRPDSYQEINNFYTVTVYEKGAEVIRMQHTLLGEPLFQRGMKIYFDRHDGEAATCEDFVSAMESALQEHYPEQDLKQFRHWYSQAGTPRVEAKWQHNQSTQELTLELAQSCPATPEQKEKPAFHIPIRLGLVGPDGKDLPLSLKENKEALMGNVLNLTQSKQTFVFSDVPHGTIPSLLRGFSAPVILSTAHSANDLMFLAQNDPDPFNRWDAAQQILSNAIIEIYQNKGEASGERVRAANQVFASLINDKNLSDGYLALAITLPSEGTLFETIEGEVDPVGLHFAKQTLREFLGIQHGNLLLQMYRQRHSPDSEYRFNSIEAGQRALKNICLNYLCLDEQGQELARRQFEKSKNMTDLIAALSCLAHNAAVFSPEISKFYVLYERDPLAIDKWFMTQATIPLSHPTVEPIDNLRSLLNHPAFTLRNPNRARSVLAAFAMQNPSAFHNYNGQGYALWASLVLQLDQINPQVAARMARALDRWRKLIEPLRNLAQQQLKGILDEKSLSADVREIISKALTNESS